MKRILCTAVMLGLALVPMNALAASDFSLPEGDEDLLATAEAIIDGDLSVIEGLTPEEKSLIAQIIWEITDDAAMAYAFGKAAGMTGVEEGNNSPQTMGYNSYPFDWKFPFHSSAKITVGYGGSICGDDDTDNYHTGKDYYALDWSKAPGDDDIGEHILAPAGGYASVYFSNSGYGNHIRVDAGNGYSYLIAHMDSVWLNYCGWVNRGQHLGTLGCSGACDGAHIHFVVYKNGSSVPQNGMSGHNDLQLCGWYTSRQP